MDNTEDANATSSVFDENLESDEKTKIRLTAVALYMLGDNLQEPPNPEDNWTFGQNYLENIKIGTLKSGSGGLVHALVNDNRIILLPRIVNSSQCHAIYADLLYFYAHDPSNTNWIIDCSSLTELPILLLSNLIAYAHKLRSRGSDLYLCWFKPEFIPAPQREKICDFFHLKLSGGYLFSNAH